LLINYEEGIGSLQERIEEGNWWRDPYTYEGVFIDIDWLSDARNALERIAPKKLKPQIEEIDKELLKIAKVFQKHDPYVLEYLVDSLGDVIPQLRHLLKGVEVGSATKF